jgi:t-SNARE complex subunit (syntaxin)
MNPIDQKEFDRIQEQLTTAQADTEQIRKHASSAVGSLKVELRLYRGLFWSMLTFAIVAAILKLLQR